MLDIFEVDEYNMKLLASLDAVEEIKLLGKKLIIECLNCNYTQTRILDRCTGILDQNKRFTKPASVLHSNYVYFPLFPNTTNDV